MFFRRITVSKKRHIFSIFSIVAGVSVKRCNCCQFLLTDQRRLLFGQNMTTSDNAVLFILSRLISNQFMAAESRYGISSFSISLRTVRLKIWDSFASSLTVSRPGFRGFPEKKCQHLGHLSLPPPRQTHKYYPWLLQFNHKRCHCTIKEAAISANTSFPTFQSFCIGAT